MSKNIVIFSDGTGQDGGIGFDSNVYKLFKCVENRTKNQIAFYDKGLGTGWRKITGNVNGAGISRNILDCYRFIFDNFEAGDQIYLFGFSRGAATVRSLSSFIEEFGILPKSRPELIKKAYKIYKIGDEVKRHRGIGEFHGKHHTMWTHVKFLGVWDTVAALGVPLPVLDRLIDKLPIFEHKFHDFDLSPGVENAYHALSIDEKRKTFLPTLWNEKRKPGQHMEQVWFSGVHSDIGGGYEETALSDIPLNWMIQSAVKSNLELYSNDILKSKGNANGPMHNSRAGIFKYLQEAERFWPSTDENGNPRGDPDIHPSVELRKNTSNSSYDPWILRD